MSAMNSDFQHERRRLSKNILADFCAFAFDPDIFHCTMAGIAFSNATYASVMLCYAHGAYFWSAASLDVIK
jgi:hypothetical protein